MNSHLIPIEIGIKCRTDQWMKLYRLPLNENRFEGLNTESVQSRSSVQHNRVLANHLIQCIPYFGSLLFHHLFCTFHGGHISLFLKAVIDKWFKKLQGHLLRKTTLMKPEIWSHSNDGPPRVIHPFSKEVLSESALLSL